MTERRGFSFAVYTLGLLACFSTWFIAIRTPLWLDETVSYWQMYKGPAQFWPRSYASFPAYSFILWLFTKILGTREIALRAPSILAMLGAVYLLYRTASELLDRDLGMVAVILFSLHPVVVFEAIDARPYAFAALAINATIYLLVRLRQSDSLRLAAAFGAMAAVIIWFQFLFGVILPALVIGLFAVKLGGRKSREERAAMWPQFGIALVAFAIAFLPVVPGVLYMFRSRRDHPFDVAPRFLELLAALAPGWVSILIGATGLAALLFAAWTMPPRSPQPQSGRTLRILSAMLAMVIVLAFFYFAATTAPIVFLVTLLGAAIVAVGLASWAVQRRNPEKYIQGWRVLLCAAIGLLPILILYGVSTGTSLHIFVPRYRIVAVPGIALIWALLLSGVKPRILLTAFCLGIASLTAHSSWTSADARHHAYTWKYALEAAENNAALDNATVLVCSDLPESDHMTLPVGDEVKDSGFFAPLSYYKLTVPVVGLPRSLNEDAMRISSAFLRDAAERHARFLAMGYFASAGTLEWLKVNAAANYNVRDLGSYDNIQVLEFEPKT